MANPANAANATGALHVAKQGLNFTARLRQYAEEIGHPSSLSTRHIVHKLNWTADVLREISRQLATDDREIRLTDAAYDTAWWAVEDCKLSFMHMEARLSFTIDQQSVNSVGGKSSELQILELNNDLTAATVDLEPHATTLLLILAVLSLKQKQTTGTVTDRILLRDQIRKLSVQAKARQAETEGPLEDFDFDGFLRDADKDMEDHFQFDIDSHTEEVEETDQAEELDRTNSMLEEEQKRLTEDVNLVLLQCAQSAGMLTSTIATETYSFQKSQRLDSVALKSAASVAKSKIKGLLRLFEEAQEVLSKQNPRVFTDLAKKSKKKSEPADPFVRCDVAPLLDPFAAWAPSARKEAARGPTQHGENMDNAFDFPEVPTSTTNSKGPAKEDKKWEKKKKQSIAAEVAEMMRREIDACFEADLLAREANRPETSVAVQDRAKRDKKKEKKPRSSDWQTAQPFTIQSGFCRVTFEDFGGHDSVHESEVPETAPGFLAVTEQAKKDEKEKKDKKDNKKDKKKKKKEKKESKEEDSMKTVANWNEDDIPDPDLPVHSSDTTATAGDVISPTQPVWHPHVVTKVTKKGKEEFVADTPFDEGPWTIDDVVFDEGDFTEAEIQNLGESIDAVDDHVFDEGDFTDGDIQDPDESDDSVEDHVFDDGGFTERDLLNPAKPVDSVQDHVFDDGGFTEADLQTPVEPVESSIDAAEPSSPPLVAPTLTKRFKKKGKAIVLGDDRSGRSKKSAKTFDDSVDIAVVAAKNKKKGKPWTRDDACTSPSKPSAAEIPVWNFDVAGTHVVKEKKKQDRDPTWDDDWAALLSKPTFHIPSPEVNLAVAEVAEGGDSTTKTSDGWLGLPAAISKKKKSKKSKPRIIWDDGDFAESSRPAEDPALIADVADQHETSRKSKIHVACNDSCFEHPIGFAPHMDVAHREKKKKKSLRSVPEKSLRSVPFDDGGFQYPEAPAEIRDLDPNAPTTDHAKDSTSTIRVACTDRCFERATRPAEDVDRKAYILPMVIANQDEEDEQSVDSVPCNDGGVGETDPFVEFANSLAVFTSHVATMEDKKKSKKTSDWAGKRAERPIVPTGLLDLAGSVESADTCLSTPPSSSPPGWQIHSSAQSDRPSSTEPPASERGFSIASISENSSVSDGDDSDSFDVVEDLLQKWTKDNSESEQMQEWDDVSQSSGSEDDL